MADPAYQNNHKKHADPGCVPRSAFIHAQRKNAAAPGQPSLPLTPGACPASPDHSYDVQSSRYFPLWPWPRDFSFYLTKCGRLLNFHIPPSSVTACPQDAAKCFVTDINTRSNSAREASRNYTLPTGDL